MAVNGLADGLLAGFSAGQQYYNSKADREYRQQAAERDQANTDRQFGLAEARYKSDDARDQRNYERQVARDAQQDKQFQQSLAAQREDRQASRAMQAASIGLRQQELAYQRAQAERAQRLQEEQPLVNTFYETVKAGNPDYAILDKISKDNPLNPIRFAGKEAIETSRQIQQVVPQVLNGKMSLEDPQAVSVLNGVLKPYIQRNIGEKDPVTGKVIKSKELIHAGLSENGQAVIPTLRVHYEDGTSAVKPMTDGGSADPADNTVTQIPISNLQQELASYAKITNVLSNPALQAGLAPYVGGKQNNADQKEYRNAVLDVQSDAAKAKAGLNKDGLMTPEEVAKAEDRIDQQTQQRMQQVDGLFGRRQTSQQQIQQATREESDNDNALMAAFSEQYQKQFGEAPDWKNQKDTDFYNEWKKAYTTPGAPASPARAAAPVAAGPSPQKQQDDSNTANYLREMQRQAQQMKGQQ